jgi:cytochrome o ubiquinol oxidase subunit 2
MFERLYKSAFRLTTLATVTLLSGCSSHLVLLDPKGPVGEREKFLIITSFLLMMIVVIPVFFMAFYFPWKYRASNEKATYMPKWSHSTKIEVVIWVVPALIVVALSYLVWTDTHTLSPFRPLASKQKAINIDAISLDWKWLFIYPDLHIATVNQIRFPAGVPVHFRITSDTVMTSFFIPQLGSQIYAMAGMETQDNLLANEPGTFAGLNSQFSGPGFSKMHFKAIATSQQGFQDWIKEVRQSQGKLDLATLHKLEKPSFVNPVTYYSSVRPNMFEHIMHKYMNMKMDAKRSTEKPHA